MSVVATTGVGVLARLINRLGSGEPMTAAGFATREGFARSTVFDVTRRMEDAGLLQRDLGGTLMPGPALMRLALAEHGLATLHGPAEALLTQLRDETHATARLVAADGTVLLTLTARSGDSEGAMLEAAVGGGARLTLQLRPNTGRAERDDAQARLARVALTLTDHLSKEDADG
jgi:DNA-binding IclR family transcriptional regulator